MHDENPDVAHQTIRFQQLSLSVPLKCLFLFSQRAHLCFGDSDTCVLVPALSVSDHLGRGADALGYRHAN